jgi:hypothetical protein
MSNKKTSSPPGVYKSTGGGVVYLPRRSVTISSRGNRQNKTENRKRKQTQLIGKNVSVRATASDASIIYGIMRVGGVYTFLHTSKDSKAFLKTGDSNYQIIWIARSVGESGNSISIEMVLDSNTAAAYVTVEDQAITVHLDRSGTLSVSTANSVIDAVLRHPVARTLVSCHRGEGTGTAYVLPVGRTFLQDGGGRALHHFVTIAAHEIQYVESLYLDDQKVFYGASPDPRWATGFFKGHVFTAIQNGTDDQAAQPDLVVQVGSTLWGENHRQRGCAGAYIITRYNSGLFPNGIPDIEFLVHGKKCFDFRDGVTRFTQNAALILADFLTDSKIGAGIDRQNFNAANWVTAANICDESVQLASGGVEPRYSINGTFTTGSSIESTIEEMLQAMAGDLVYQGGEWFCYPGAFRQPSWVITTNDLMEEINLKTSASRRDRFNAVRGTYMNAADKYSEDDYSSVKNSYYATQDGQVIYEDIPQPFVTSNAQCQRVAKIELERVRQGIEVDATLGAAALALGVGDVVYFDYERLGWNHKLFEVRDLKISDTIENGIRVEVKLRETAEQIYVWSAEETTRDLAPDTDLPTPYVSDPPSNLVLSSGTAELYIRNDGTVFSRLRVSWTKPDDLFVTDGGHYEIQYKKSASQTWVNVTNVSGDQSETYVLDVQDGISYDVRIKSVNTIGVSSGFITVTGHIVLGKSAPPTTPTGLSASLQEYGIFFSWSKVPDLDVREYELRLGASWDTAQTIARVAATSYSMGLRKSGNYFALLKAIDTSGNYSTGTASLAFSIPAPSAPVVSSALSGEDVVISWAESVGTFAVESYLIKVGSTLETSQTLAQVKALNYRTRVNWLGTKTFFVQAVDVAGNVGNAGEANVTILRPSKPNSLTADVIDNNVLLRWTQPPTTSLPIIRYELTRGEIYETSFSIGSIFGSFATHFEFESGSFTYHVVSIDSAGNASLPSSITAKVEQPNDFKFFGSHDFDFFTDTTFLVDASIESSKSVILPTSHKSWEEHFNAHGWDTIAEQITDGYPYLIHPTDENGEIEVVHDFGAILTSSTVVSFTYLVTQLSSFVDVIPTISVSTDNTSWNAFSPGLSRVFAQNVRFVKISLSGIGADDKGLAIVSNLGVVLSVKEGTLAGNTVTNALGSATVDISDYFSDVQSILLTPGFSSYAVVAVYDFVDTANPTQFTVFTFRADNGAVASNIPVSYSLKGYLA